MSDDKLVKGFNNAWLMKKYRPELAEKLYNSFKGKDFDYAVGFRSGMEMEQPDAKKEIKRSIKGHRNIDHLRFKKTTKEKSKEKDLGDLDR